MGIAHENLYATNIGPDNDLILISAYVPIKKEEGYYMPEGTPLGYDEWYHNSFDLKPEEGTVEVEIIKSDTDTGDYIMCYDGYFGGENHLFSYKPEWKEDHKRPVISWTDDSPLPLHVNVAFETQTGDGPISVTFSRK